MPGVDPMIYLCNEFLCDASAAGSGRILGKTLGLMLRFRKVKAYLKKVMKLLGDYPYYSCSPHYS